MNPKEAWQHVQNGGVVTSGGYTYFKDGYFAYGTYPGCIRGCDIDEKSFLHSNEWKPLEEIDIIVKCGYKPCQHVRRIETIKQLPVGVIDSLVDFLEERLLVKDYPNTMLNAKLCKEFFEY